MCRLLCGCVFLVCLNISYNCTVSGSTFDAWQSPGGLWHTTRWRRVCSRVTDGRPSSLQTTHEQTQQTQQWHVLSARYALYKCMLLSLSRVLKMYVNKLETGHSPECITHASLVQRRHSAATRRHTAVSSRLFLHFLTLWPWPFDLILIGRRGIMMFYPFAKFGDFYFSRFDFNERTNRQTMTYRQNERGGSTRLYFGGRLIN